jgi:hypothetical protein
MTEISRLLNDLSKQFSIKMNEIYEQKERETKQSFSYDLNNGYTKDYGKLDITKINYNSYNDKDNVKNHIEKVNDYFKNYDATRYIIHLYTRNIHPGSVYSPQTWGAGAQTKIYMSIIDNYGDYMEFNQSGIESFTTLDDVKKFPERIKLSYSKSKYILPDVLINLIKSQDFIYDNDNKNYMTKFLKEIAVLSEDYYKKIVISQYINKKNGGDKIKKTEPCNDVLFQRQIEDFKKEFTTKINEICEKKTEEKMTSITYNLDSDYTKNYGKIDISTIDNDPNLKGYKQHLQDVDEYFQKNDGSRYIIHAYNGIIGPDNKKSGIYIIDNYGDYVFNPGDYYQNYNVITFREDRLRHLQLSFLDTKSKYILPNILIHLIKKMNKMNLQMNNYYDNQAGLYKYNILDCFKVIAEDYYKRLTHKSGSVEIEELNKQYLKQIEQLTEENTKINHSVQPPKEIPRVSSYDDILIKEIKELQMKLDESKKENEKLKKENHEISKKFSDMQSRIKEFIGV